MKKFIQKHRIKLIIGAVILCLVAGWYYYNFTAWERDLTVVFIDLEYVTQLNGAEDTQYIYEITNNTNYALRDVEMVFKCYSYGGQTWLYKGGYKGYLPQGATKEFRISKNAILKFNEENNKSRNYYKHDLVRVKYRR